MSDQTCHPNGILWLKPLVHANEKFYGNCTKHGKILNMYCMICKGDPICHLCCEGGIESNHNDHNVLQIFRSTHKNALKVDDIKRYTDGFGIKKLRNNGDDVFLIATRGCQDGKHHPHDMLCNCGFNLKPSTQSDLQYCSIQCKMREILSTVPTSNATSTARHKLERPLKYRRKQRNPCRSPLF